MNATKWTFLAAVAGTLGLAACGGGGGGGGGGPAVKIADIRAADPAETISNAGAAATAVQRFGSVTQSSNVDGTGVTTDRAGAAFADGRLRVTVARQGKTALLLDTNDAVAAGQGRDTLFGIPGAARTVRSWATLNVTGNAATISGVAASWANDDPADWLAGGYWLHLTGSGFGTASLDVTGAEVGAFVDGPELSSQPASLPTSGTATFRGLAAGLYASEYGTDFDEIPRGSTEIGDFEGVATLTADFAGNTVSGCIGCTGQVRLTGIFIDGASGATREFDAATDYRVHLGALSFDGSGRFSGDGVTLSNPTLERAGIRYLRTVGSWGGQFSNQPVATGEPRLAAGTFGGETATGGGSRGVFIGAFAAGKQQ